MSAYLTPVSKNEGALGGSKYVRLDGSSGNALAMLAIPGRVGGVHVQVDVVGSGTYVVEYTGWGRSYCEADTAVWRDWYGANMTASDDLFIPACIGSVRVRWISGTVDVNFNYQ